MSLAQKVQVKAKEIDYIDGRWLHKGLEELRESYDLLLKTARRAARDLNHAIDQMADTSLKQMFRDRYRHYDLVFGGTCDYRANLHIEMDQQERKIEALERQLKKLDPNADLPF